MGHTSVAAAEAEARAPSSSPFVAPPLLRSVEVVEGFEDSSSCCEAAALWRGVWRWLVGPSEPPFQRNQLLFRPRGLDTPFLPMQASTERLVPGNFIFILALAKGGEREPAFGQTHLKSP